MLLHFKHSSFGANPMHTSQFCIVHDCCISGDETEIPLPRVLDRILLRYCDPADSPKKLLSMLSVYVVIAELIAYW